MVSQEVKFWVIAFAAIAVAAVGFMGLDWILGDIR